MAALRIDGDEDGRRQISNPTNPFWSLKTGPRPRFYAGENLENWINPDPQHRRDRHRELRWKIAQRNRPGGCAAARQGTADSQKEWNTNAATDPRADPKQSIRKRCENIGASGAWPTTYWQVGSKCVMLPK